MSISRKFKASDKKIEQNKAQCNLGKQTAKISNWQICFIRKRLVRKS